MCREKEYLMPEWAKTRGGQEELQRVLHGWFQIRVNYGRVAHV
jgi:hypothetical protein